MKKDDASSDNRYNRVFIEIKQGESKKDSVLSRLGNDGFPIGILRLV